VFTTYSPSPLVGEGGVRVMVGTTQSSLIRCFAPPLYYALHKKPRPLNKFNGVRGWPIRQPSPHKGRRVKKEKNTLNHFNNNPGNPTGFNLLFKHTACTFASQKTISCAFFILIFCAKSILTRCIASTLVTTSISS
jgi:hypothetical protein